MFIDWKVIQLAESKQEVLICLPSFTCQIFMFTGQIMTVTSAQHQHQHIALSLGINKRQLLLSIHQFPLVSREITSHLWLRTTSPSRTKMTLSEMIAVILALFLFSTAVGMSIFVQRFLEQMSRETFLGRKQKFSAVRKKSLCFVILEQIMYWVFSPVNGTKSQKIK